MTSNLKMKCDDDRAMTPVLKRTLANVLAHALLEFHLAVALK